MNHSIIDAHAHCGIQDRFPPQSFEDYYNLAKGSGIEGVVMFSPVMEIYDRYDHGFEDNDAWRQRRKKSNEYLLAIDHSGLNVIPYFFIWNDFAVDQLTPRHKGIKWHRHSDEPIYHYDDPRCRRAIEQIRHRNMPVVLEEELVNTIRFIDEIAVGVRTIIPHLGLLNGGYKAISNTGLWERPNVYTDTALASQYEISDYINTYGCERMLFGSDFPFGNPQSELVKILNLNIPEEKKAMILGLNLKNLIEDSNCSSEK